jgi:hypothetical protein
VLETYTFTIHYTVSEDGRRIPSGLAASSSKKPAATTKATNIALQQLLRSVDNLCQDLPRLPGMYNLCALSVRIVACADLKTDGRLLSMEVIYETDKGATRIPTSIEGFVAGKGGDELSFANAEGWQIHTKSLEFTTGCHE